MPRWVFNLLLVTGGAAITLLAASFFQAMMDIGILPEPRSGVWLVLVRIFLLSLGPTVVLYATRKRDNWFQATGRTS